MPPLAGQQFDVIFSENVVVVLLEQRLRKYLADLDRLLASEGCIFLENGYGAKVFDLMRALYPGT